MSGTRVTEAPDLRAADRLIRAVMAKLESNRELIAASKAWCRVDFRIDRDGKIEVDLTTKH